MGVHPGGEIIFHYFPNISSHQKDQFLALYEIYTYWNKKINVISRKDMDQFYQNHVLHSLGIAKIQNFLQHEKILDVGTGGGFPGIPLAILYPQAQFHLIDSIGKKINVVKEVVKHLGLSNVTCDQIRAEEVEGQYDYIVSRAVTRLNRFIPWIQHNLLPEGQVICLKGGDLEEEIREVGVKVHSVKLSNFFSESFFESKKVLIIKGL